MATEAGPALTLSALFEPQMLADPYPLYHRLRADDPVHWDQFFHLWALTRHADVVAALRDARLSSQRFAGDGGELWDIARLPSEAQEAGRRTYKAFSELVLMYDPPEHTRLRAVAMRAFTPRVVERMHNRIQELVDGLLDVVEPAGEMDVLRDLAYPLPATVIMEMLGIPPGDRERFKAWAGDFATSFDVDPRRPQREAQAVHGVAALCDYVEGLIARRRATGGDDLLQAFIAAGDLDDPRSASEIVSNVAGLLFAGHETTTNLIGNGLLTLLRHPAQLQRLRDDPAMIGSAVEELLRFESPVQWIARRAREPLEIGGKHIGAGQLVGLFLGAANRDPEQFPQPDRLKLDRHENRHLAFAHGIHFCVGAALARMEAQIAIDTVVQRLPMLRLATHNAEWRENVSMRGLNTLPVVF